MIKITITPPNQPSFSQEFHTVSDAYDFLAVLQEQGYKGAKEAAQQSAQLTGAKRPHVGDPCIYCGATITEKSTNPCPGK